MTDYNIHTHQFRFCIWAASRAYARGVANTAMPVPYDTALDARLHHITSPDHTGDFEHLGLERPDSLDLNDQAAVVDAWTVALIKSIQAHSVAHRTEAKTQLPFGCAAKLLSVYLKGVFLNEGNLAHQNIALMHPPVDALLLNDIADMLKGDEFKNSEAYKAFFLALHPNSRKTTTTGFSWQNMGERSYLNIIAAFRTILAGQPIWMIEQYWFPNRPKEPNPAES